MSRLKKPRSSPDQRLYAQPLSQSSVDALAVTTEPCEICRGRLAQPVFELTQTTFEYVQCKGCGLVSLFPRPTGEEIAFFYPEHYYGSDGQKFSWFIEFLVRYVGARHARFLLKLIHHQGRVLDVGCGRGFTLQAIANEGVEAHGFEVSQNAVQGIDPRILVHLAESLVAAQLQAELFDEVILWHVLEHIPNPRETIEEIHRILRPGGVLLVAVPNFSSWQSQWSGADWFHLDPPRHLYQFPLHGLVRLLEETGFQVLSQHHFSLRQNPFGWIQSALNRCAWLPRNSLYEILHRRRESAASYDLWTRVQLFGGLILLTPWALFISVWAALARRGATIHLVARRTS